MVRGVVVTGGACGDGSADVVGGAGDADVGAGAGAGDISCGPNGRGCANREDGGVERKGGWDISKGELCGDGCRADGTDAGTRGESVEGGET